MKKIIFLMVISNLFLFGFDEANDFYKKQQFSQALKAYKKIRPKNAVVWYNMGNAAYHADDKLHAYVYWLRAQKYGYAPIARAAHLNIQHMQDNNDVPSTASSGWFDYIWFNLFLAFKFFSFFTWQLLFIFFWLLLFYYRFFYQERKRPFFYFLFVFGLIISLIALYVLNIGYKDRGVVQEQTELFNGPNSSFYVIKTLPKGSLLVIKDMEKDWYKIVLDGSIGWAKSTDIIKV